MSSAELMSPVWVATPMLAVTRGMASGRLSAVAERSCSAHSLAPSRSVSGRTTRNSSPPQGVLLGESSSLAEGADRGHHDDASRGEGQCAAAVPAGAEVRDAASTKPLTRSGARDEVPLVVAI